MSKFRAKFLVVGACSPLASRVALESSNGEFVESIKESFTRRLENEPESGNRLISYISLSLKKIVEL